MTLRVLFVHNAYQHRGGEDSVVEAEMGMLEKNGHSVKLFSRHNDSIESMSRISLAVGTVWSSNAAESLKAEVRRFAPDVVHVHNTFPLLSPSIYWAAAAQGKPVVQTLHNFRLMCVQAIFLKKNKVCERCLGGSLMPGVLNGCYRESRIQSAVLATALGAHRLLGTFEKKVTRYIALNEFCRDIFVRGGLPAEKISIKPNFVDYPFLSSSNRKGFLFVGRLSPEKGLAVLAEAVRRVGIDRLNGESVTVVGDGVESALARDVPGISLKGLLSKSEVREAMNGALALVLPSICYESFPMTLVEAYASGLPVIASRIGALAELVEDGVTGLLFNPGDADDLARKLCWIASNPDLAKQMGKNARRLYERRYSEDINLGLLVGVYEQAIGEY